MKQVLIVSYRFPPHGGGGVHRIVHFARHLPAFGWHPHVLTGPEDTARRIVDPTLLDLIPRDVRVTRTASFDGARVVRFMGKLRLGRVSKAITPSFPNMNAGWIPYGIRAGSGLLRAERIDVLYSSAYPMSSHIVAAALKRRFGVPWVADYRDEWSQREVLSWPTPIHRTMARRIDQLITRRADRVVTTSPAHTESFTRHFPSADPHKYQTVMNGFDSERFVVSEVIESRPKGLLICHVGSLFDWRGPGAFLEALRNLTERGAVASDEVSVRFVGNTPELDFGPLGLTNVVESLGYVPHERALGWLRTADALLLINTETTNILAKTFEYLASGRPILALTYPGPTADLIRENEAGIVVAPDDVEAIAGALLDLLSRWRSGTLSSRPTEAIEATYSRRASAARLAHVLESVAG